MNKMPAVPPDQINYGCGTCSDVRQIAPMDKIIAVGFGAANLTRDGQIIFQEQDYEDLRTFAWAEEQAMKQPDADWRITLYGPLHGEVYQRQGVNYWVLIESNEGFA